MTPAELINLFPEAVRVLCENPEAMRRLNDNTAAVMPLHEEVIHNDNTFAPVKREIVRRLDAHLWNRLDRR